MRASITIRLFLRIDHIYTIFTYTSQSESEHLLHFTAITHRKLRLEHIYVKSTIVSPVTHRVSRSSSV